MEVKNTMSYYNFSSNDYLINLYKNNQQKLKVVLQLFEETMNEIIFQRDDEIPYYRYEMLKLLFAHHMHDENTYEEMMSLREFDDNTFIHSFDVFYLGTILGAEVKLPKLLRFSKGLLLHDLGKLDTPIEILQKNGRLTDEERSAINNHPKDGYDRILTFEGEDVACVALTHHEKLDGSGYPNQLEGNQVPTQARVSIIVDVYSALTLKRSYKEGKTIEESTKILQKEKTFYDTKILGQFVHMVQKQESHGDEYLYNEIQKLL